MTNHISGIDKIIRTKTNENMQNSEIKRAIDHYCKLNNIEIQHLLAEYISLQRHDIRKKLIEGGLIMIFASIIYLGTPHAFPESIPGSEGIRFLLQGFVAPFFAGMSLGEIMNIKKKLKRLEIIKQIKKNESTIAF